LQKLFFDQLGRDYAGYYPLGDERALARLLWQAESNRTFYRELKRQCAARRRLLSPRREAQMNAFIEERVRETPSQYYWLHKRFKTRPPGEPSFYP
jgi:hypothetical protein